MQINRVRTLILNSTAGRHAVDAPGEEYVATTFRRRKLTPAVRRLYQLLFGTRPDRLFVNIRMRQIMQLLHTTELAPAVGDRSQLTYLPFRDDFPPSLFVTTVTDTGRPSGAVLSGTITSNTAIGRSEYQWDVRYSAATGLATVTQQVAGASTVEIAVTFTDTLSTRIPLHENGLTVRFYTDQDAALRVVSRCRPTKDFSNTLNQLQLGSTGIDAETIFDPALAAEQSTYLDIWQKHPHYNMRYAAMFLALANYVEEQEVVV